MPPKSERLKDEYREPQPTRTETSLETSVGLGKSESELVIEGGSVCTILRVKILIGQSNWGPYPVSVPHMEALLGPDYEYQRKISCFWQEERKRNCF